MHSSKIIILSLLAALAIFTGLFSYGGGIGRLRGEPNSRIWETAYQAIDRAQIYYAESLARGGSNATFEGLTFPKLGYSSMIDSELTFPGGRIALENTQAFTFDITLTDKDGTRYAARNLTFDTRPVFAAIQN
ncbi:MAG: hypothetical protein V2A61_06960 [Calditrichota bacterium]